MPRRIEHSQGQRHPHYSFIGNADSNVAVVRLEEPIPRHQRSRMAVVAKSKLDHVEYRRRSAVFAQQLSVVLGARSEIAPLDRHRMELRGAQHRRSDEQIGDLARVASFIVLGHDPFIHLKHLQVVPMDAQAAQIAEHPPRCAAAAQGKEAATALRGCTPYLGA